MDLGKTCRTCLRSDGTLSPLVVSITPKVGSVSSGVVDLWKIYTRLLVTYDSALPDLICDHCVDEIQQTYSFLVKCESSESYFRVLKESKEETANIDDEYMDISEIKNESLHVNGFIPQYTDSSAKHSVQKTPANINHSNKTTLQAATDHSNKSDLQTATDHSNKSTLEAATDNFNKSTLGPATDNSNKSTLEADADNSDKSILQAAPDEVTQNSCEFNETSYKFEVTDITDNVKYTLEIVGDRVSLAGGKVKQEVEVNFDEDSTSLDENTICKEISHKNTKTCPACSYQCDTPEVLGRHIVDDHILGSICTICKQEFKCTPLEHSSTHLSIKQAAASDNESDSNLDKVPSQIGFPYKCEYCRKPFRSKTGYSYHMLVKHDYADEKEKVIQCTVCSKFFKSNSALESHMRTHNGQKPYTCGYCSKMFVQKGHLTVHIRCHTGDRPYKCTFCPKDFSDKREAEKVNQSRMIVAQVENANEL
ncbi:unnamed protein product [Hermetia illucens]|uniref:Uncharacterized protein n=1 Tax=Hermetia illucens TaxID=343691 RepID=A0A7R8UU46_HERIL|nr:unnamed protein product [Hermetia illucens]